MILQFLRDEEGATAIEYSLVAALLAIMIIVSARTVGNKIDSLFQSIANSIPA
ncbi:MAG: Flp family type IVb pilin [Deltaproteobacteria bacterium]|nr:MAG: Flp family type IVb pilin [Deltaproteobacteria bacterium]